jgi:hypothetical protein
MNALRTRLNLDSEHQKVHNNISDTGDRIVGWVGCIGLVVFVIIEITGRFA